MPEGESYVAYSARFLTSSDDSPPKASREKRQLNIRLKLREIVLVKTSDENSSQEDRRMDVPNALKLCNDGFAEVLEDTSLREFFKSFNLSPHAYLQRFEFYKALSDIGLGGNSYSGLRDELVKNFEAFADSLCRSNGVTRACSFTANLSVVKVDFVCYESEADMSSISGDGVMDDEECNSGISTDSFE